MNLFSNENRTIWKVTDLTRYLRDLFESDELLQDTWVEGEISNFSRPSSGHLYFTLKDSACALRCVMWRGQASRLAFMPRDGQAIVVHGSLSIYEVAGQYQLYADILRPAGEGELFQQFLELKARLESEGLFDPARKRPIPTSPRRIGIVTSPTGAALRDMINVLRRRYPLVEVIVAPTPVQGIDAPAGIISALQKINRLDCADVILLARGGGSIEDLWAFNDEGVARAVATSKIPIICGIGHETDFTIADFVCDLRAPTPTAAAELASPEIVDLRSGLDSKSRRLMEIIETQLSRLQWSQTRLQSRLKSRSPSFQIRSQRQHLDDLARRLEVETAHQLETRRLRFQAYGSRLSNLSPAAVIKRGYAIIYRNGRLPISSITQVVTGETVHALLTDGVLGLQVLNQIQSTEKDQLPK